MLATPSRLPRQALERSYSTLEDAAEFADNFTPCCGVQNDTIQDRGQVIWDHPHLPLTQQSTASSGHAAITSGRLRNTTCR